MANIKISELDELVNVADNDYLPIVDTSVGETKKIQTSNLKIPKIKNEKTQSDTDTYSCNYLNKNILTIVMNANFTSTAGEYVEISNWVEENKIGTKLNVSNGKIKIGKDVSYIKITGQFGAVSDSNERYYFWTKKNGTNVGTWVVEDVSSSYREIPFNQFIPVAENDVISVAVYTNNGSTIEKDKTTFIIEAI